MEAFVLLKARGDHRDLMEQFSKLSYIQRVYNIAGDNDILIEVKMKRLEEFKNLINEVRSIENILDTTSYIVLSRYK